MLIDNDFSFEKVSPPIKGRDSRNGKTVLIVARRPNACKSNKAVEVSNIPDNYGNCVLHQAVFIPGGEIYDELLCEYEGNNGLDDGISWVNGKHIKIG